ncbi:diguanylate cyclase, partial [bacterium]
MTLRVKTLLIVGASLGAMLVALFLALRPVVLGEFARAEKQATLTRMSRSRGMLNFSLNEFAENYQDWAKWDDTYRYMADGNSAYESANLGKWSLATARVNFLAIVANDGTLRFGTMFDEQSRQTSELPPQLEAHLQLDDPLLATDGDMKPRSGLLAMPDGPMMVAALPITSSAGTAPRRGTILFGRYLNRSDWMTYLGAIGQNVQFLPLDTLTPNSRDLETRLKTDRNGVIARSERNEIAGYTLLRDFYNRPIGLLRIAAPMESLDRGNMTLWTMAIMMALCGILFLLLSLWPIEKLVLSRLGKLNQLVDVIRSGGDIPKRIDEGGTDELAQLAFNINRTFSTLQTVASRQKRSERLYRQMAETALNAGDAYFVWQAGEEFLDWHGDIDSLLGYPQGGMKRTQKAWLQHIHFVDQGKVVRSCARALALSQSVQIEFRVIRCDGTTRHWMIRGKPLMPEKIEVPGKGEVTGMPRLLAVCIDITARKESEEALRQSEERLQRIFDTSADAIVIVDRDGQISYANETASVIFGLLRDEITSRTIDDPEWNYTDLNGGAFESSQNPFHRVRATGERIYDAQYGVGTPEGNRVIVSVNAAPLLDARGNFSGMVASFADVTERRTLEDRLKYQAFHDSLTGLANRSLFRDRLEHALMRRDKAAVPVAVLFIDLDNFKYINDSLGHAVGDELIVEISSRLRVSLRAGDTAARFGGDEFVVLLELSDSAHYAIQVAERLLEALREPFFLSGREVFT